MRNEQKTTGEPRSGGKPMPRSRRPIPWALAVSATLSVLMASPIRSQPVGNAAAAVMGVECPGTPTVTDGEGNVYGTVRIGDRCWMKEDLRATKFRNGASIPTAAGNAQWSAGWQSPFLARRDHPHGSVFLYNFRAVQDARGICPVGWSVPSASRWSTLKDQLGGQMAGRKLKSIAVRTPLVYGWSQPNLADNASGFSGLPGGRREKTGAFSGFYSFGNWWSSTAQSQTLAAAAGAKHNSEQMADNAQHRGNGFAVRCLRDAPLVDLPVQSVCPAVNTLGVEQVGAGTAQVKGQVTSDGGAPVTARGVVYGTVPEPSLGFNAAVVDGGVGLGMFLSSLSGLSAQTMYFARAYATNGAGTCYGAVVPFTTLPPTLPSPQACDAGVTDVDGNTYGAVRIGTQCWMKQNLKTRKYRDGTPIARKLVGSPQVVGVAGLNDAVWYEVGTPLSYHADHGNLYTHGAVVHPKEICPVGWHVPSDAEWNSLVSFLDPSANLNAPFDFNGIQVVSSSAGGALKSTETLPAPSRGWKAPNGGATNSSGFEGLPGGARPATLEFVREISKGGAWWTSTPVLGDKAWFRGLQFDNGQATRAATFKNTGNSVRCVKD